MPGIYKTNTVLRVGNIEVKKTKTVLPLMEMIHWSASRTGDIDKFR